MGFLFFVFCFVNTCMTISKLTLNLRNSTVTVNYVFVTDWLISHVLLSME